MELREAFEAADTDKGGALELEEVKILNTYFIFKINILIVYWSIRWCYWERNES